MDELTTIKDIRTKMDQHDKVNIFDYFAAFYSTCDSQFRTIRAQLTKESLVDIDRLGSRLHKSVLPSSSEFDNPLNRDIRDALWLVLLNESLTPVLKAFAVLRAIDRAYGMSYLGKAQNWHNFQHTTERLNIVSSLGSVYMKDESRSYQMVRRLRAKAELRKLRSGDIPSPAQRLAALRDHIFSLSYVSSEFDVDYGGLPTIVAACLPSNPELLRLALVPLLDNRVELYPRYFPLDIDENEPYVFGIRNGEHLDALIQTVLSRLAQDGEPTLVLFPELSAPLSLLETIKRDLSSSKYPAIKLVVVGTIHEQVDGEWHNIAYVLGPQGQVLWKQRKLDPFICTQNMAKESSLFEGHTQHALSENIRSKNSKPLVVRDCLFGRMTVLICKDFIEESNRKMILEAGVDFIMVPAMTADLGSIEFVNAAKHYLERGRALVCISNACSTLRKYSRNERQSAATSFVAIPVFPQVRCNRCEANSCTDSLVCVQVESKIALDTWPDKFYSLNTLNEIEKGKSKS